MTPTMVAMWTAVKDNPGQFLKEYKEKKYDVALPYLADKITLARLMVGAETSELHFDIYQMNAIRNQLVEWVSIKRTELDKKILGHAKPPTLRPVQAVEFRDEFRIWLVIALILFHAGNRLQAIVGLELPTNKPYESTTVSRLVFVHPFKDLGQMFYADKEGSRQFPAVVPISRVLSFYLKCYMSLFSNDDVYVFGSLDKNNNKEWAGALAVSPASTKIHAVIAAQVFPQAPWVCKTTKYLRALFDVGVGIFCNFDHDCLESIGSVSRHDATTIETHYTRFHRLYRRRGTIAPYQALFDQLIAIPQTMVDSVDKRVFTKWGNHEHGTAVPTRPATVLVAATQLSNPSSSPYLLQTGMPLPRCVCGTVLEIRQVCLRKQRLFASCSCAHGGSWILEDSLTSITSNMTKQRVFNSQADKRRGEKASKPQKKKKKKQKPPAFMTTYIGQHQKQDSVHFVGIDASPNGLAMTFLKNTKTDKMATLRVNYWSDQTIYCNWPANGGARGFFSLIQRRKAKDPSSVIENFMTVFSEEWKQTGTDQVIVAIEKPLPDSENHSHQQTLFVNDLFTAVVEFIEILHNETKTSPKTSVVFVDNLLVKKLWYQNTVYGGPHQKNIQQISATPKNKNSIAWNNNKDLPDFTYHENVEKKTNTYFTHPISDIIDSVAIVMYASAVHHNQPSTETMQIVRPT